MQNPAYSSAYYNLGNLSEQEGNREGARKNFEKSLQADPANESAFARLAAPQTLVALAAPLLPRLVATAHSSDNSDVQHAVGKAYEQLGKSELAWDHFSKGNASDKRIMPAYDPARTEADFEHIMTQCNREWLSQFESVSSETVFICGMFRSGSTLLEQMLASHPGFVAGGESEFFPRLIAREFSDYPRGLDNISIEALRDWKQKHSEQSKKLFGESARVTDKRPDNFLY